jgi:hypothetical protein
VCPGVKSWEKIFTDNTKIINIADFIVSSMLNYLIIIYRFEQLNHINNMKILKRVLLVLVILIAIPLIAALFLRKDYAVEREVTINKPKQEVFEYVKYLKNQNKFSKWANLDPNMKQEFRGTDGTVGFVSAWESQSDDVGKGEQEIKGIKDGERIDYEIRFLKPFESTSPAYMTTETVNGNQTKVKWGFSGHMPYPMNLMLSVMNMEQMLGDDFQLGLNNLKGIMEKQ